MALELIFVGSFVAGLVFGYAADRLAARWPAHEDGAVRAVDWRTAAVCLSSAAALFATTLRFGASTGQLAVVGLFVLALIVLFATDLDQRLLPDVITYPLIWLALVAFATGLGPFVHTGEDLAWAAAAAVAIPGGLFLLSIPFGQGAIGLGDLKLLVSVGLLAGALRLFYALVVGAVLAGVVIGVLVVARRLSMRSYVPYGPFLILGSLWAILALAQP